MQKPSLTLFLMALVGLLPRPVQADRPALRAVPAKQQLAETSRISDDVRETFAELNGHARGPSLIDDFVRARRFGGLTRWALELQSIPHDTNGNYLYRFHVAVRDYRAEVARNPAAEPRSVVSKPDASSNVPPSPVRTRWHM